MTGMLTTDGVVQTFSNRWVQQNAVAVRWARGAAEAMMNGEVQWLMTH